MVERTADAKIRTTEWEDIQYKHGNRVGQYRDKEMIIIAQKLIDGHQDECLRGYDPVAEKVHDKASRGGYDDNANPAGDLEATAGSDDDDEDDFLAQYKASRRQALEAQAANNKFGRLRKIAGSNYVAEITEASANGTWVVAALVFDGHEGCDALLRIFELVSVANPSVKFVYMPATEAVAKFPKHHAPCVLIYRDGKMVEQTAGMDVWGGRRISQESVGNYLSTLGVVPKERDDDVEDASLQTSKYYVKM